MPVLALVALGAELTSPQALVLACDDRVLPAAGAAVQSNRRSISTIGSSLGDGRADNQGHHNDNSNSETTQQFDFSSSDLGPLSRGAASARR
jgi:hypothetical protein